jgi:hypothetical protein
VPGVRGPAASTAGADDAVKGAQTCMGTLLAQDRV